MREGAHKHKHDQTIPARKTMIYGDKTVKL